MTAGTKLGYSVLVLAMTAVWPQVARASVSVSDANGLIGYYAAAAGSASGNTAPELRVVSPKGYVFTVVQLTGAVGSRVHPGSQIQVGSTVYYSGAGCTGDRFVEVGSVGNHGGGFVLAFGEGGEPMLWYSPKRALPATTAVASLRNSTGACSASATVPAPLLPILPNDPVETGVPNVPAFTPPITIDVVSNVFRSSFEFGRGIAAVAP